MAIVRIPSVLHLDQSRNGHVGAPISHASNLFIFHPHILLPPFQLLMLTHCLLLKHWCKIPANESHLFLPSQPPTSPLLHFIFYTFSCPSSAMTPGIPTPFHTSLLPYTTSRLHCRDSKMYLSSLLSRMAWYQYDSCISI